MTNMMLVAISVAVSVVVDLAVDCGLLIKHGIGSKEYRNSLKFAKNNENVVNQHDIIENCEKKISQLENQVNIISRNINPHDSDISEIKREIGVIKRALSNYQSPDKASDDDVISALEKLTSNVTKLKKDSTSDISRLSNEISLLKTESNNTDLLKNKISQIEYELLKINKSQVNTQSSFDSSVLEQRILQLSDEIISIKMMVNSEKSDTKLEQLVRRLSEEIIDLRNTVSSQQIIIESLKKNSLLTESKLNIINNKDTVSRKISGPKEQIGENKTFTDVHVNVVRPDKSYVRDLIKNLDNIKGYLGEWEFERCEDGLKKLLDDGDFEDGEEIIGSVHELIKKYIYGSDTKVSATDWEKLEKYIVDAGYVPVKVKVNDDINRYKPYFDRPIPASGGIPNKIKQIQLKPFVLAYEDNGEKEMVKLCGKCTYYKNEG